MKHLKTFESYNENKPGVIAEVFDTWEEFVEFSKANPWIIECKSILPLIQHANLFKIYQDAIGGPFHFVYKDGEIYTGFIKGNYGQCKDGNNKPISVEDVLKYF